MNKLQIKLLEPNGFSEVALGTLCGVAEVEYSGDILFNREIVEVLFIRLGHQINEDFLKNYPSLCYIVSPTTGEEHVDKKSISSRGIRLLTLKGETEFLESVPATAEFTWGLILTLTRNISLASQAVIEGEWDRDRYKGNDLSGKTIALVGFGRVAKIVARYAAAFGMQVKAFDPYAVEFSKNVTVCDSLASLATGADILSIHASLTDETFDLISTNEIRLLPKHAIIINSSRGEILNSGALLTALESGKISAAAIDVISEERSADNSIKDELINYAQNHSNLVITPHLAGATVESMARTEEFMVGKLLEALGY